MHLSLDHRSAALNDCTAGVQVDGRLSYSKSKSTYIRAKGISKRMTMYSNMSVIVKSIHNKPPTDGATQYPTLVYISRDLQGPVSCIDAPTSRWHTRIIAGVHWTPYCGFRCRLNQTVQSLQLQLLFHQQRVPIISTYPHHASQTSSETRFP